MIKAYTNGYTKEDIQGLICNVPPIGYVYDEEEGKMTRCMVSRTSKLKHLQVWKRPELPKDWRRKRGIEQERQLEDPDYFDPELEAIRQREWKRRLYGFWFYNNGIATYITGLHYYYLTYFPMDSSFPDFRDPDRKYFYFMDYCCKDPDSLGMLEVTKRKFGKTMRSGAWMLERISRMFDAHGGIQSKTGSDAAEVFEKGIARPFRKMPDFFRPVHDTQNTMKKVLRFFAPGGKIDLDILELESHIDFRASGEKAYDGPKLKAYIGDEVFKLEDVDMLERHRTVRMACEIDGEFKGKMLYTSTVEDMAGGKTLREARDFWKDSDQGDRDKNNRTKTGLYRYFTSAKETMYFDKYGFPDIERGTEFYMNTRESLRNNPRALSSYIKKNPFSIEEALMADGESCLFNAMRLNEQIDLISWQDNVCERGNFMWKNGDAETEEVVWVASKNGRFRVSYLFDDHSLANKINTIRGRKHPGNKHRFCIGCDPYDHNTTVDNKRSNGAAYVFKKFDPLDPLYSRSFIAQYVNRPATAAMFYDDMLKMCVYYGASMLFEDNKPGIGKYFERKGFNSYLIKLPGKKEPGIPGSRRAHQHIAELLEAYIEESVEGIPFVRLLNDLVDFDITNTTSHDETMAAGYTLIADQAVVLKQTKGEKVVDISQVFKRHKIA